MNTDDLKTVYTQFRNQLKVVFFGRRVPSIWVWREDDNTYTVSYEPADTQAAQKEGKRVYPPF